MTAKEIRFAKLAARCKTTEQLTRLWNWADNQPEPERMFRICDAVAMRLQVSQLISEFGE
jgi:hypothetical protein